MLWIQPVSVGYSSPHMKVVFWDWNGTLVNDASVLCDSFNRVLQKRGIQTVSLDRYREISQHPVQLMYEEMGLDFARHSFQEIAEEWHRHYCDRALDIQLHHDSLNTLQALQLRGARQMVLSALPKDVLTQSVRSYSVENFFEHVVGIHRNRADTKVAEGVSLLRRLGVKGTDVTIIGDSSHDVEVARELKAHCILVARGAESRSRLEAHGFPVLDSFSAIIHPENP